MACHMSREARITTAYARDRRYLRAALSRYHALLAQVPDKPGPVDALPLSPRRGHGRRAQGHARAAAGNVRRRRR
jgi:hypothetical protein